MDIPGISRTVYHLDATTTSEPVERIAGAREVVQAVKAVNQAEMFGPENELLFQRDTRTQKMVIRVVNRQTQEVVSQIPPEYVLRLAEDLKSR